MNTQKLFFQIVLMLLFVSLVGSCSDKIEENTGNAFAANSVQSAYDGQLADELGADDYGMKQYVMAFLKTGSNRDQDSLLAAELQRAHLENIRRMAEEGDLVLAGPFMDSGEFRGIYIFNVQTVEEAQKLTETDPAIQAGRLVMELHPWYGSAALVKVNEIHGQISKQNP